MSLKFHSIWSGIYDSINVMPGLGPGIHVFVLRLPNPRGRDKPGHRPREASSAAVDCNDLVAGRVAQVSEIVLARRSLAPARRVLDALAAVGDTGVVEGLGLLGARAREADGPAVRVRRGIAVDRLGDAERAGLCPVEDSAFRVHLPSRNSQDAEHGVIESLGRLDI